jgi:tartrate-resistant acid phosphatase type 5
MSTSPTRLQVFSLVALASLSLAACGQSDSGTTGSSASGAGGGSATTGSGNGATTGTGGSATTGSGGGSPGGVRFAVIGDFGDDFLVNIGIGGEADVAAMVAGWNPDFVITLGDNNYPDGAASTIDANIGKYYHQFIGNYTGTHGPGSPENRFWPSPGNHDWNTPGLGPDMDYFTLPGNERYYDVDLGLIHLFALDSDSAEPDGIDQTSAQAMWFQQTVAASTACYDIAFFHHPPYSSGSDHGSTPAMQWPFEAWGADVVLAGHDHIYERLLVDNIPYFVNGLGGSLRYSFGAPLPESQFRYDTDFGAMLVTANKTSMTFEFYDVAGTLVESHSITKNCP